MTTTEHTTDFVRVSGIAPIKKEYLILTSAQRHTIDDDAVEQKEETGAKAGGKKGGQKGQNKGRKFGQNKDNIEYCPFLTSSRGCDHGDNCKYTHDAKAYLEKKEPDIGKECVNFRTFGMCNYGLRCRFAGDHTDENGQNVVNEELVKVAPVSATVCLDRDTADKLKKQKYDYTLAKPVIKFLEDELREFQKREKALSESRKAAAAAAWAETESSHQTESNGVQPLEQKQEGEISISNDLEDKVVATEATLKNTGEEQQKQEGEISISNNLEDNVVATEATSKIGKETLASNSEAKKRSVVIVSEDIAANPTKKRREDLENDAAEVNTTTTNPEQFLLNDNGKVETYDDGKVAALPAREKKKHIDFRGKTYLAPLTTVGNLPFRRLCKGLGVDITCGEMAMGHQLLAGHKSEWALMKRHASEDIFGVQVCGSKLDIMTKTAELISNHVDCDFVDLNMGCPIDIVFKKGAGSALMDSAGKLGKILRGMNAVLDVPLTIKFRTGVHDNKPTALKLIPRLRDWGCALGTIHGRSRQQRYTKLANWDYITECAEAGKPMPIFGNGDVIRQDEYYDRIEKSGVAGIMMGRGPLIKPWIFTEIKERRDWDITATERLDIMRTFCNYGLEHWGSDTVGVNTTRRYLCEWQSFTHRYVPVGLLEQGIMMNDRPPAFKGRNEMETLLASQDAADWVKISEMFLGKAPDSFKFLPKHKANSYDNPIQG